MHGSILEHMSRRFFRGLCDVGLFYCESVQYYYHGGVDRARILEESPHHLLNCVGFKEEGGGGGSDAWFYIWGALDP